MFHRVLLAGVGALGSEVVKNLGLQGCGEVYLADADLVRAKNISRSILLRDTAAVGQSKVLHALDRLRIWFPETRWNGAPIEIADVSPDVLQNTDVLFSCVDTDLARTEIAALANRYRLPVIDAGLGGTSTRVGRVSWFPGTRSAACFACLLSSKRRAELFSIWESDVHACWADHHAKEERWTSTPTMASIVAGLQVEFANAAAASKEAAFSLNIDLDRAQVSEMIRHRRSDECPLHDQLSGSLFPICSLAACGGCGTQFAPGKRIGWVRRWGACPSCGSRDLTISESTREEMAGNLS